MKINSLNLALASAITTAIVWVICSLLVWMMPGSMMNTTGNMVHMDMSKSGWMLSPLGFFWGLIVWSLFAGIFAWLLATVYNFLTKN
jgi:cell division protein FtsX